MSPKPQQCLEISENTYDKLLTLPAKSLHFGGRLRIYVTPNFDLERDSDFSDSEESLHYVRFSGRVYIASATILDLDGTQPALTVARGCKCPREILAILHREPKSVDVSQIAFLLMLLQCGVYRRKMIVRLMRSPIISEKWDFPSKKQIRETSRLFPYTVSHMAVFPKKDKVAKVVAHMMQYISTLPVNFVAFKSAEAYDAWIDSPAIRDSLEEPGSWAREVLKKSNDRLGDIEARHPDNPLSVYHMSRRLQIVVGDSLAPLGQTLRPSFEVPRCPVSGKPVSEAGRIEAFTRRSRDSRCQRGALATVDEEE